MEKGGENMVGGELSREEHDEKGGYEMSTG